MSEQIKPGSIFVDEFMLFTDKGEEFDLKTFIVSISIFEDLFSNVLSGMAIITDNLNLVGTIPIVGREIINVRARVPGFQNCQINRAFFIYSVQNRAATSQDRQQTYEIHFISLEGMVDNITFVSKKYNGPTDEIAEKIFNEYLRLPRIWSKEYPFPIGLSKNNNLLNPEWYPQVPQTNLNQLSIGGGRPFKSKVCWVVPMWTPFKAINWLANRSIDGSTEGPNVLCWESSQGFYFASMDTIFENQKDVKNRKNFYYGLDDAGIEVIQKSQGGTNALAKGYEKVEDVVIPMVSDVLKSQDYGHMASNMHVLDIAVKDYKIYSNMIAYGNDVIAQFKQAYNDAKQTYEVVQEDGKIETWSMERDVDELKAEILLDIVNFEKEVEQATKLRNEAYGKLKDKNYDLVTAPNN